MTPLSVEAGLDSAQTRETRELHKNHRLELLPGSKGVAIAISLMLGYKPIEQGSRNRID
jgi:hypothetical protein